MTVIPNPPQLGDEFTNEITGVKYKYDGIKWVVVAPAHVPDDLEAVLNQGNVADKGFLLTDGEDALIAAAPDEALITIASDTSKKNPRLRLTHIDEMNYPNAQAQIELDQDGTRVDFEFDQAINDVHFRFDDNEKFILNKDGDAEFTGKVEGEPGTQNNEFVTFGQLTTLEEEIEQLAPSLERGSWTYTPNYPPAQGEYTLVKEILDEDEQEVLCQTTYTECVAAAAGNVEALNACNRNLLSCQDNIVGTKVITTAEFVEATRIYFNDIDANGTTHSWAEIPPDHFIDIFNEADENFLIGDITSHTGGNFSIDVMSSKGTASGIATVKIFRTQGTVDFDSYVRKSGDTMSGALDMQFNAIENAGKFEHEHVETLTSNCKRAKDIYLFQRDGKGETYLGVNGTVWVPELLNTKLDLDGNAVPWSSVEVGDYIKVHENGDSSNRYSIFGPVTKITEYNDVEGIDFVGIGFEDHHAIVNGPLVIRVDQKVTISRVQLSGKESNIITDFGGEIHGRVVIRHPGAGPVEIHASDLGDNYSGSGIQIYGYEDKKFVEISSSDGRLKCYDRDGTYAGANTYADVVTRGYLIERYGSYNHLPSGFEFNLMYMENASDSQAKEHARKYGQWAKTNNGIWINHLDKHRLVDLSPYYTSNQGTFANPDNVEEDSDGEVSTFGDEVVLDYQGAYGQRAFLSIYQEYNRDKLGLRRVCAISKVIWYKNEPFIKLEWTKNFNLDSVYYTKCILSLPGII